MYIWSITGNGKNFGLSVCIGYSPFPPRPNIQILIVPYLGDIVNNLLLFLSSSPGSIVQNRWKSFLSQTGQPPSFSKWSENMEGLLFWVDLAVLFGLLNFNTDLDN